MAQKKINPVAFRLAVKQTWWSNTNTSWSSKLLHEDQFIRKLVHGVFKSFNIYTSEIIIHRKNNLILLNFLIYKQNPYYSQASTFKLNPNFPHNKLSIYEREKENITQSLGDLLSPNIPSGKVKIANLGIWKMISDLSKNKKQYIKNNVHYLHGNSEFRYHYINNIIKLILNKYLGKKIIINISQAPSFASNAKIFADILSDQIKANPNRYKLIVRNAIKSYTSLHTTNNNLLIEDSSILDSFKNMLKTSNKPKKELKETKININY